MPCYATGKAVAAAGAGHDIGRGAALGLQHLAQARDMNAEAAFLDGDVRPDPGEKLLLRYDGAGSFEQHDEDVERAASQADIAVVEHETPLGGKQLEGAKLSKWHRGRH